MPRRLLGVKSVGINKKIQFKFQKCADKYITKRRFIKILFTTDFF
jgi:hypothetical protein